MKRLLHARFFPVLAAMLVAVIVILLGLVAQQFLWKFALDESARDHFADMDRDAFLLGARIRGRANDMFFLKRVAEQELAHDPNAPVDGDNFRSAVTTMMLARSQYNPIRLLNLSGREIFRYNWEEGPNPLVEVPHDKLQDKAGRPFYRATLEAPPDSAVFSPFDLDIDNGQIIEPKKPVVRVSGQIMGPDGKPRALLVLNYLGDQLLRELKLDKGQDRQTMLLNSDGYWLVGPHPQSEWAFMFPERKPESLMEREPALWKKITSTNSGTFDEAGSQFCYLKVDPLGTVSDYPPLRMQVIGAQNLQWILLTKAPNAVVWSKVSGIGRGLWLTCAGILLTLVPMTWLGLSSLRRRRLAMEEMQRLTQRAQAAERAKGEFLAIMSHEIRTPMNGVIGITGLLLETNLNSEQFSLAETVRSSADSLLNVINDILDFSKIEAGKFRLEEVDFDLRRVVENTLEMMAGQACVKGIELVGGVEPDVPALVLGDPGRVQQILTNLIGNAIKFTKIGEVVVRVTKEAETSQQVRVRFEIRDTGIGVSPEAQTRLFQPFVQADNSTSREFGGTGLGLAICKRLVESMNGTVSVESAVGFGSTFSITLPFSRQISETDSSQDVSALLNARVLIADGNEASLRFLHRQMVAWRLLDGCAARAEDALKMLRQSAAEGIPYQVAMICLQMPDMDGFALAREIASDPRLSDTRIIMLMPFGKSLTADELKKGPITVSCTRPIRQSALFDCLVQALHNSATANKSQLNGSVRSGPLPLRAERILVAEDNIVNRQVAIGNLLKLGYKVDLANNGIEVLDAIKIKQYDIIFMDCQMPEMNGYQATKEIRRQHQDGPRPWIIAMTANVMQGDREKCLEAGMDDYVAKPLNRADLRAALDRSTSKNSGLAMPDILQHLRIDEPDMLTELIELFVQSAPATMLAMRAALEKSDAAELRFSAHTLRGSCSNLGKFPLGEICSQIERAADGKNISEFTDLVDSAGKQLSQLITALRLHQMPEATS